MNAEYEKHKYGKKRYASNEETFDTVSALSILY